MTTFEPLLLLLPMVNVSQVFQDLDPISDVGKSDVIVCFEVPYNTRRGSFAPDLVPWLPIPPRQHWPVITPTTNGDSTAAVIVPPSSLSSASIGEPWVATFGIDNDD